MYKNGKMIRLRAECAKGRLLCVECGVNYDKVIKYRNKFVGDTKPTWEECIDWVKNRNWHKVRDMAEELGVSLNSFRAYVKVHKGMSFEDIVNKYKKDKRIEHLERGVTLKQLCDEYNIDYSKAKSLRHRCKYSYVQTVLYYRPDLKINIFGEIVDEER